MQIRIRKNGKYTLSEIFWSLYFLMIALPLHASNKILSYISVTGKISFFHILLAILFIYFFIRKMMFSLTKQTLFNLLFGLALVFTTILGLCDGSHIKSNVIGDGGMYFLSYMVFVLLSENKIRSKTPMELLRFTFHAMTVNLLINILMYFTRSLSFWGVIFYNGGRFGGGYYSLLIITIVYGFYDFMYEKKIKTIEFFAHVGMAIFCSILAQSRTHVVLCVVGCALVVIFRQGKLTNKYLFKAGVVFVVATVGIVIFLNSDNALVARILSTDITSRTGTIASRITTWTYYWREIKENLMGTGFGEVMYFINPSFTIAKDTSTYYVDNAFACVFYKGGFFLGVVYFVPLFATVAKLVMVWWNKKKNQYLILATIYTMFIFAVTVLTSQIIHTYATNVFAWAFAGVVLTDNIMKVDKRK